MDTPYSYNEMITPNSNTNDGNDKCIVESKQKKNDILSVGFDDYYFCYPYFFIALILCDFIIGSAYQMKNDIYFLFFLIPFCIMLIYLLTLPYSWKRKIEISKQENQNEKIIIKIIHWYCNTMTKEKNMKDIHFEIDKYDVSGEGSFHYRFFIINDFPNKEEINLDFNNIKSIPLELYEVFDEIKNYSPDFEFELNNFINKNNEEKLCNFIGEFKMIKINDKFSIFFLNDPFKKDSVCEQLIWIIIILDFLIIFFILWLKTIQKNLLFFYQLFLNL